MGYVAPSTRATDDVISAAIWNQDVRDNVIFVYSPPCVSVKRTAVQSIANNTAGVVAAFDAENYDTDAMHSTVTNNSRVTIVTAGKYLITGTVSWASNATGRRLISILANGATIKECSGPPAGSGECGQSISGARSLIAGDYIELGLYQDSGGALNATPEMEVTWVAG